MHLKKAQGATEYLVLLAVVLIIALVGIALLAFFPGTAGGVQATENDIKAYAAQSATPIQIISTDARVASWNPTNALAYMRIKNVGIYKIRLTALIDPLGVRMTQFGGGDCGAPAIANISDYYEMGPGEEKYFGHVWFGTPCTRYFAPRTSATGGAILGSASEICQNSTAAPGKVAYKSFGFEYIQYFEGQEIRKRQYWGPLTITCSAPQ